MHLSLQRLVEANDELTRAERALAAAQEHRRQCARNLAEIEDQQERISAAVHAYRQFGKGLSIPLAEAVTGYPGRQGVSAFLVLAGRLQYQPSGKRPATTPTRSETHQCVEWRTISDFERDVVRAHIAHSENYWIDEGLGWQRLRTPLNPAQATDYLIDPTAAIASSLGLSRVAFVKYLSSYGSVPCDGQNQDGARCKSGVAGHTRQLDIEDWMFALERGGYCRRHGGDPEYDPRGLRIARDRIARQLSSPANP